MDAPEAPPRPFNLTSVLQSVPGVHTPSGKLAWSPSLDIRVFAHPMLKVAIDTIPEERRDPYFADFLLKTGTTEGDMEAGVKAFADALCAMRNNPKRVAEVGPGVVMQESGFFDQAPAVQTAIMARMGKLFVSMFAFAANYIDESSDPFPDLMDRLAADLKTGASQLGTHQQTESPACQETTTSSQP